MSTPTPPDPPTPPPSPPGSVPALEPGTLPEHPLRAGDVPPLIPKEIG